MSTRNRNIIITVLCIVLVAGAIFGAFAIFKDNGKSVRVKPTFSIGELEYDGKYKESTGKLYTKEAFKCNGLKIKLAFDSNISYQIYYYDYEDNYIFMSGIETGNMSTEVPFNAKTCRIVITPNEDVEIKWYQVNKYAKQLTITVSTTQYESLEKKLATYKKYTISYVGIGVIEGGTGAYLEGQGSPWLVSAPIYIGDYTQMVLKVPVEVVSGSVIFSDMERERLAVYKDGSPFDTFNYNVVDDNEYMYFCYNIRGSHEIKFAVAIEDADLIQLYMIK